jgi:hypothetical protein
MRHLESVKGAHIMRHVRNITVVLAMALLVLAPRSARADEHDESMTFTFSGPVEVPGAVLPAGTYQFKLADPDTDRNVVQILSTDGSQVYATLLTMPNESVTATDDPIVRLEERPAGSPEAIRAICYPGATGMEFVYPADRNGGEARVMHGTR